MVIMRCSSACWLCGYLIPHVMTGQVVVNKRSLRSVPPQLGGTVYSRCPECGERVHGGRGVAPRSAYRLDAASEAKIAAIRKRRWGIDESGAVAVERVA